MKMSASQSYFQSTTWPELSRLLQHEYADYVVVKTCDTLPNLVLLFLEPQAPATMKTVPRTIPMPVLMEWHGIILATDTMKVVSYAQSRPAEDTANTRWGWSQRLEQFPGSLTMSPTIDGTLIRCFRWQGQWRLATDKFPDAAERRWIGPRFFSELFQETVLACGLGWEAFEALLDSTLSESSEHVTHVFKFLHPANRMVIPVDHPQLFYLGSRRSSHWASLEVVEPFRPWLIQSVTISAVGDVTRTMETSLAAAAEEWLFPGVTVSDPLTGQSTLVTHPAYQQVAQLKGNTVHMTVRMLEILLGSGEEIEHFLHCFPEYSPSMADLQILRDEILAMLDRLDVDDHAWRRIREGRMSAPWYELWRQGVDANALTFYKVIKAVLPDDYNWTSLNQGQGLGDVDLVGPLRALTFQSFFTVDQWAIYGQAVEQWQRPSRRRKRANKD